jgi:hypothetical protein
MRWILLSGWCGGETAVFPATLTKQLTTSSFAAESAEDQAVGGGVRCLVGLLLERVGVFKETLTRSNHQYLGQRLDVRQVVLNGRFDSRYKYIKSTGNRQHTDGYFEWPPTPFYDVWCIDQR